MIRRDTFNTFIFMASIIGLLLILVIAFPFLVIKGII